MRREVVEGCVSEVRLWCGVAAWYGQDCRCVLGGGGWSGGGFESDAAVAGGGGEAGLVVPLTQPFKHAAQ